MRIIIPKSTQATANPTRIFHSLSKHNVKIQVFDAVTLFISLKQADLNTNIDNAGNPSRGLKLVGPMQAPMDFLAFSGELWASCNQQIEIEVLPWPLVPINF